MASPNFSQYIDLTVSDLDVQTVYNDAVQYAQIALPEFTPRVGTIENAILESVAYATRNLVYAINRQPDGLMEGLLALMGFSRIEATNASGTVTIELIINTGATITAGTLFSYNVFDSQGVLTQYLFETTEDLTISSGNTTGTVAVIASNAEEYPNIPTPSSLTIVSSTPFILTATLASLTSVGTNTETDAEYFMRAVTYLGSLSSSIATASQMTNYIAITYPTVSRYKVYDLTDSKENKITNAVLSSNVVTLTTQYAHGFSVGNSVTVADMATSTYNGTYTITAVPTTTTFRYAKTNSNIPTAVTTVGNVILATGMALSTGNVGGAVTISMCDSTGVAISDAQKLIIKNDLTNKVVAGLNIYLHDMNTFNVDVACTVVVKSNYSTATVGGLVSDAIEAYLSVAGWDFASSVNSLYLTTIASQVEGVKYVSSIDASINGSTSFASDNVNDVTILQKGVIPIGTCTTIATA